MRITILLVLLTVFALSCTPNRSDRPNPDPQIGKLETKVVSGGRIWSLDWSPDGKYIACGNSSGLLRIYDAESLELVNILTGFTFTINGIHWSPDGNKIVASGPHDDPRIIIWDLAHKTRKIIDDHERQIRSVKWSPLGTHFASTSHDGTIRIWKPDGTFVKMFTGANFGCVGIDWQNEDRIAASCWDNTIRIYTLSGSDSLLIENGNHRRKAVLSIDWHPNGKLLATGDYGNDEDSVHTVKIWTDDGQLKSEKQSHEKEIRSLAWNKTGTILATGGETVRLWDAEGNLLNICEENTSPVWSLDWNADGTKIASGHNDGKIRIWDTSASLIKIIDGHASETTALAFNMDSTHVLVGFADGTLAHYDLHKLKTKTVKAHSRSITNIEWSFKQNTIALSGNEGTGSIWFLDKGMASNEGRYFGKKMYTKGISWHPDNTKVAYLDREDKISIFSRQGVFLYSLNPGNETPHWKNGTPIVFKTEDDKFKFNQKIFVKKDDQTLVLIPLNQQRFALIDSLNNIIYGDKEDFILMQNTDEGFTSLLPIK